MFNEVYVHAEKLQLRHGHFDVFYKNDVKKCHKSLKKLSFISLLATDSVVRLKPVFLYNRHWGKYWQGSTILCCHHCSRMRILQILIQFFSKIHECSRILKLGTHFVNFSDFCSW